MFLKGMSANFWSVGYNDEFPLTLVIPLGIWVPTEEGYSTDMSGQDVRERSALTRMFMSTLDYTLCRYSGGRYLGSR